MSQNSHDRTDIYFLISSLTLVAGVPITLYSIYYFAQSIQYVATVFLVAILLASIIGILIVKYREKIVNQLFGVPIQTAASLAEPASDAIGYYIDGEKGLGNQQFSKFVNSLVAYVAWIQTRRWIMAAAAGLLIGFAGLVGSALLKQQNDLILDQNRFFQQQIEQQQRQLEAQQTVANQTVRSEAIRRIYGPEFASTPRVKAEAVRSLVTVERLRIARGINTLPTEYINLHNAQLQSAWLDSADLRKISFRASDLVQANLSSTMLGDSVFRFTKLSQAVFIDAKADRAQFMFLDARKAVFSKASLRNANINQVDMRGAALNGADVTDATFFKVNLENADLSGLVGWKKIKSIDNTNIANLRGAPEGFKQWALSRGAIEEPGNLLGLPEAISEMRQLEETAE